MHDQPAVDKPSSANDTFTVSASELLGLCQAVLQAVGTPADLAKTVSHSLVDANLAGHDSHGVQRLPIYVELVRSGQVRPAERPLTQKRNQATAEVDGAWGWGQPAAQLAVDVAIELALEFNVSAVTIARCNHIGRLGEYVERLALSGMAGLAMCNTGAVVAPFGGRARMLGTNPFAFAAPGGESDPPMMIDFATASVAEGKLMLARAKNERIPSGSIIDSNGYPSVDPDAFYAGGALLPFGAYKGYGMSVMVELLGGILSGGGASSSPSYGNGNGAILIALKIEAFRPLASFMAESGLLSSSLKRSPTADGFREVLLPGEPETMARRNRQSHGIPVPLRTWNEIDAVTRALGLKMKAAGA